MTSAEVMKPAVAGAISGRALFSTLPHLPLAGRLRLRPANGVAAEKPGCLLPPPAAAARFSPDAPFFSEQGVFEMTGVARRKTRRLSASRRVL
jgi:hypothetical protein